MIYAVEQEFGIVVRDSAGNYVDPARWAGRADPSRYFAHMVVQRIIGGRSVPDGAEEPGFGGFLPNGGRAYLDDKLVEMATRECADPYEMTQQLRLSELVVLDAAARVAAELSDRSGEPLSAEVTKSSTYGKHDTIGSHRNFLLKTPRTSVPRWAMDSMALFDSALEHMTGTGGVVPHFATEWRWVMATKAEVKTVKYHVVQRHPTGQAGGHHLHRLEFRLGGSRSSEQMNIVNAGAMAHVLAAIEEAIWRHEDAPPGLPLPYQMPNTAFRDLNGRSLQASTKVGRNGREKPMTPIEIFDAFFEFADRYVDPKRQGPLQLRARADAEDWADLWRRSSPDRHELIGLHEGVTLGHVLREQERQRGRLTLDEARSVEARATVVAHDDRHADRLMHGVRSNGRRFDPGGFDAAWAGQPRNERARLRAALVRGALNGPNARIASRHIAADWDTVRINRVDHAFPDPERVSPDQARRVLETVGSIHRISLVDSSRQPPAVRPEPPVREPARLMRDQVNRGRGLGRPGPEFGRD